MNRYGIIAAMQEEMKEIENIMQDKTETQIYELKFVKGTINESEVILVQAGVGKVNAARTTQILIANFKICYLDHEIRPAPSKRNRETEEFT